eukprot:532533-Pyramimonas_sp.AAC.1
MLWRPSLRLAAFAGERAPSRRPLLLAGLARGGGGASLAAAVFQAASPASRILGLPPHPPAREEPV